jgi:HTH-type transcriptional regulator / antitoxin HipB
MLIPSAKTLAIAAKGRRHQLHISQAEVANKVGLRQKTVSAFESKPESTKLETFFKLLSAMDLELHIIPKEDSHKMHQGWDEEW